MSQLLSNLPTGAKVKFGKFQVNSETAQPIVWTVVAKTINALPHIRQTQSRFTPLRFLT